MDVVPQRPEFPHLNNVSSPEVQNASDHLSSLPWIGADLLTGHFYRSFQTFALIAAAIILSINVYFIFDYVTSSLGTEWFVLATLAAPTVLYMAFVAYLVSRQFLRAPVKRLNNELFL